MPTLVEALEDPDVEVRGRAGAAIRQIIPGIDFRFRAADPPDKRRAAVRRIRKYWPNFYKRHQILEAKKGQHS